MPGFEEGPGRCVAMQLAVAYLIALVAFGCFVFNYVGVNIFITGLHSYAGV